MYNSKCVYYKQAPEFKVLLSFYYKKTPKDITCIISPGAH